MGSHVDIDGQFKWVNDRGRRGTPVLLLHGGLSNSDELLNTIGTGLAKRFRVIAFDRRGHGYTADTADTEADFHYDDMGTETIRVLEQVVGGRAHLVGWSDGGIVGLLVVLKRPDLVDKLIVVGTNYHYDGAMLVDMVPESLLVAALRKAFVERSPDGPEHLDVAISKGSKRLAAEPTLTTADIAQITRPVLVVVGDDDLVALPHTVSLYESLPDGQLAVVPGASHALPLEQPDALTGLILNFLTAATPPHTLFPVRRARTSNDQRPGLQ